MSRLGHIAALGAMLLLVWPLLDLDGVFISDEGSYRVQVKTLLSGTWDMGYPFSEHDPDASFAPFDASVGADGSLYPYVQHPAWPAAMAGAGSVVGEQAGLRLFGVLSVVALAAVTWELATELGVPRASRWAFWVAASSPVLANAWITWAHAPAAALGGLLLLGVLRARTRPAWAVAAVVASAALVLIRSEGLLWAIAVAAAAVAVGRSLRVVALSVAVLTSAGAALVVERMWSSSITGAVVGSVTARGGEVSPTERLGGLRLALLDGAFASGMGKALGVSILLVAVFAAIGLRSQRWSAAVTPALVAVAALLSARVALAPDDPAPGLLVACPVLILASVAPLQNAAARAAAVAAGLFVAALAVSIYPDGGSIQWGGRFLSPILAPAAALAGAGLMTAVQRAPKGRNRWVASAAVVMLVVQAAGALIVPQRLRELSERPMEVLAATGVPVLIADGRQIARLDPDGWPGRCWVSVPEGAEAAELRTLLRLLERSGVAEAMAVGFEPSVLGAAGAEVLEPVDGVTASRLRLNPSGEASVAEPFSCL